MPVFVYLVVAAGTLLWFTPFVLAWRKSGSAVESDPRARWGIALQFVAYSLLWQGAFWTRRPAAWTIALAFGLLFLACLISWTSAQALGRQFRLDAAVGADHELITSGPYRWVRHPIYTSMLFLLLGTGLLMAPLYLLLPAIVLLLIGAAIRINIEDKLLAARFGESFTRYRKRVSRLIPFVV
jgi:protein-S-isoprenylcysteine O-methyltransferase Ste14